MEESITEMSRGTPANIKLDSRRSASKQLTRQGEMIFFVISFLRRYSFTKNLPRDEDPLDEDCVSFEKFTMHLL